MVIGSFPESLLFVRDSIIIGICTLFLIAYYCGALAFTIPKSLQVGSRTIKSVIHRWTGINTLLFPVALMVYEATYHLHPDVFLYLFSVLNIALNCIFGALLIPKRIPKWDLPTIRIFVVASTGGLSFLGLSLNFRFGHIQKYDPVGQCMAVLSLLSIVYALNDTVRHVHQLFNNLRSGSLTLTDLGFHFPTASPKQLGLKDEYPTLRYCFVSAFLDHTTHPAIVAMVTSVPSNVTVVVLSITTMFFGMAGLLQIHYLVHGYQGMVALHAMYPKLTRMAVYGFLGAALANNYGTFAGTLVIKRKMSIVTAAMINAMAALVPIVEVSLFALRYHDEERLDGFILDTLLCKVR